MQNNNQNIEITIFLDIDGVLADFDGHAKTHNKFKGDGKLDFEALDFHWWSTIPAYDGAKAFYDNMKALAKTKLLTAPMVSPHSHHGKAVWLEKFDTGNKWALMDMIICPSRDKHYLACEGRILVDDRIDNVEAWRQAGGHAVHHTGNFEKTLNTVMHLVKALQNKQDINAKQQKTNGNDKGGPRPFKVTRC